MNIAELKKAACLAVGLDENDPLEKRTGVRPFARHLIYSRLLTEGHSDEAIAMAFGVDRATVLHGHRKVREVVTMHMKPHVDWLERFNGIMPPEQATLIKARINGQYSVIIAAGRGSATLYPDRVQILNKDGIKDYPKSILLTDVIRLITDKEI